MKKKIIGIFLCMLIFVPVFSATVTASQGPILELDEIHGGMGLSTSVMNTGEVNATDIIWTIEFKKAFPILGKAFMVKGEYTADLILNIPPGESEEIEVGRLPFDLMGFGLFRVTVSAWSPHANLVKKTVLVRLMFNMVIIRRVIE